MKKKSMDGFSLLEIIVVLAIIGLLASLVIPNLTLTLDSKMSFSLRQLTSQIRGAYDNAVFSGRLQRLVMNAKTGEFFVEQAPLGFRGRPSSSTAVAALTKSREDQKKQFLEQLERQSQNDATRIMSESDPDHPISFTQRSIPVVQKDVLKSPRWFEVNDKIIYKQQLAPSVIFAQVDSELAKEPLFYNKISNSVENAPENFAFIYFLPSGTTSATSIRLATLGSGGTVSDIGPKYTINLNTITGQSFLLEGFQDANFTLPH